MSTLFFLTLFPPTVSAQSDSRVTYDDQRRPIRLERDRNHDGTPDVWVLYTYEGKDQWGELSVDRTGDGVPDYWKVEWNHQPVREWGDLNGDGRVDYWVCSVEGRKQWVIMDKNHDGRPDAWVYYGARGEGAPMTYGPGAIPGVERPVAGEIDEDFDGTPDRVFGDLPKDRPALEMQPSAVGHQPKTRSLVNNRANR